MSNLDLSKEKFELMYNKQNANFVDDFYLKCLKNSISYKRIAGYFNSSIFDLIKAGLKNFIDNKGKIQIICNTDILNKQKDLIAINQGYKDRYNCIISTTNTILKLFDEFHESSLFLYLLIKNAILDIKIVEIKNENINDLNRLLHSKIGIFSDEKGNTVAFIGSHNETFNGWSKHGNEESFEVFCNWENDNDAVRCKTKKKYFDEMWNDKSNNEVIVLENNDILKIYKEEIIKTKLKGDFDENIYEQFTKSLDELKKDEKQLNQNNQNKWDIKEAKNNKKLRSYQIDILNNWENNDRVGLFNMCTGAGKTFTTICAIQDAIFNRNEVPLILVPSKLLEEQWKKELKNTFGLKILIYTGDDINKDENCYQLINCENSTEKIVFLITYQTASKEKFLKNFKWNEKIFLIADEVHNIGAKKYKEIMNYEVGPKIGLSATPIRKYDEEGSMKILEYFDSIIKPIYQIGDGIRNGTLCRYNYYFKDVELNKE